MENDMKELIECFCDADFRAKLRPETAKQYRSDEGGGRMRLLTEEGWAMVLAIVAGIMLLSWWKW